jgi:hypothetical protein
MTSLQAQRSNPGQQAIDRFIDFTSLQAVSDDIDAA